MRLIFPYGQNKTIVKPVNSVSKIRDANQLTSLNRKFLKSLGYKVLINNEYIGRVK